MAGSGHSFTGRLATDLVLPPRRAARGPVGRPKAGIVTVESGCPLHKLNPRLEEAGLALTNMGDIEEQTVAGAISTGTHGTGRHLAGLAAQVPGWSWSWPTAPSRLLADRPPTVPAARLGLGALGVVTAVTFRVVPAFQLRARGADALGRGHRPVRGAGRRERPFRVVLVPPHRRLPDQAQQPHRRQPRPLPRAEPARRRVPVQQRVRGRLPARPPAPAVIPVIDSIAGRALGERATSMPPTRCSPARAGCASPRWSTPSPARPGRGPTEVRALVERHDWRIGFPVEVRVAPADDVWLSTANGREHRLHRHPLFHTSPHKEYFRDVEEVMTAVGGRPHWGKLHTRTPRTCAASTRSSPTSALRDRSTRTAGSATPTWTGSWAPKPRPGRRERGRWPRPQPTRPGVTSEPTGRQASLRP